MGFSPLQNLALQEKLSDQEKVHRQLQTERQEREMELKQEVGQVTIDSLKTVASTEVKKKPAGTSATRRHSGQVSFHHDGCFTQMQHLEQNLQELREKQTRPEAHAATSEQVCLKQGIKY